MATLTLQLHTYRSKRPIRRTGCLAAQQAVQIPGLPAGVHVRDWAEQLIGIDRAISKEGDFLIAEVTAGDLDELQHMVKHGPCPDAVAAAAVELQLEPGFLDAACRRLAEGDQVCYVATERARCSRRTVWMGS